MSSGPRMADAAVEDEPAVRQHPAAGGGPLVRDYLAGVDLSPFFTGHFSDLAAYRRKAAEVETRLDAGARAGAAAAIEPLGDSAQHLERILAGDGFFVTTGQQPALFGGPLYTLYKILGAIRLAATLERKLGRPVLALFWIGSDDHDWEEANHTTVLDEQKYPRIISVHAPPDAVQHPLSRRRWGPGITAAVEEFADSLPDTIHADAVMAHVRPAYAPDRTVADSFAETLRFLLGNRRLAVVDSAHPALRAAAAPVMRADVERVLRGDDPVARQTARLEAAGYDAQVAVSADASNLMMLGDHGRDRLVRTGRGWTTRRGRGAIGGEELLDMIVAQPERFSPNVLLRPVVESAVFPTIAYVAGPGELSYFAQIGCLFATHGMLPPVVVPRPGVTLIDAKLRRMLERLDLDESALARPLRDVIADATAQAMPTEVSEALANLRDAISAAYARLAAAAETIDPTLRGTLTGIRNASLLDANDAEKKISARIRDADLVRSEQIRRAAAQIQPNDSPQERVFGPLSYVAVHGPDLVARIEARLDMQLEQIADWTGPACDEGSA